MFRLNLITAFLVVLVLVLLLLFLVIVLLLLPPPLLLLLLLPLLLLPYYTLLRNNFSIRVEQLCIIISKFSKIAHELMLTKTNVAICTIQLLGQTSSDGI